MALKGIVPVTITPMNEKGVPDAKDHEKFLEHLLKYPIGGLYALGSAGECFLMTLENRLKAAKMITDIVDGRVPVLMGAEDAAMDNIFLFIEKTADLSIHGYHIIPHDVHMNHNALVHFYTSLADFSPKPIWLYHNAWRGCPLPHITVRELSQHPNVAGLKAGGDKNFELIKFSTLDSEFFQVIGAGGGQAVQLLSMGLKAHTVSQASCFPDIFCEIFTLWQEHKNDRAMEVQKRYNRLWGRIPVPAENSETSAQEKGILEAMDICRRFVSRHYRPVNDDEMLVIREVLKDEGYL